MADKIGPTSLQPVHAAGARRIDQVRVSCRQGVYVQRFAPQQAQMLGHTVPSTVCGGSLVLRHFGPRAHAQRRVVLRLDANGHKHRGVVRAVEAARTDQDGGPYRHPGLRAPAVHPPAPGAQGRFQAGPRRGLIQSVLPEVGVMQMRRRRRHPGCGPALSGGGGVKITAKFAAGYRYSSTRPGRPGWRGLPGRVARRPARCQLNPTVAAASTNVRQDPGRATPALGPALGDHCRT